MNLEKTYYVTQIVAVFCLVCSLIYVGLQVSQNTREMRISAFREEAGQMIDLFLLEAQDPELLDLIVRAETDFESLQPLERRRAMGYATAWLLNSNASYETVLQGLRPDILEGMTEGSRQRYAMPFYRETFEQRRNIVREEFQDFLDTIISESE